MPRLLTSARWVRVMATLCAASVVVLIGALQFGATRIDIGTVLAAIRTWMTGGESTDTADTILWQVRLPRILLAFLAGGGLAAVGVALQALLRNALADPYVLGVSSGAALGVALAMLFGWGITIGLAPTLPAFGFIGSVLTLGLLYRLARTHVRLPVQSLLLAGVILNAILTALIMFITSIMEPNRAAGLMAWLMGSLGGPGAGMLTTIAVAVVAGVLLLMRQASILNLLTLGEETARSLGVQTERAKARVFLIAALLTGAVVSVSGMIGFVGMIVPHAVRLVLGSDHRLLVPASALVGGMFLVLADTVARTLLAPAELPVGVVTALAGGPFFLYILLGRKAQMA
ncbi:MAG: iron ABC transporter permease [Nitrospiraceae bacterium]